MEKTESKSMQLGKKNLQRYRSTHEMEISAKPKFSGGATSRKSSKKQAKSKKSKSPPMFSKSRSSKNLMVLRK